jgi:hypothetical protein
MKRVYTSMDPLMVEQVRAALDAAGIGCVVEHRDLRPLAGLVPVIECWPEVWVIDDARAAEAEALVEKTTAPAPVHVEPWRCSRCGQLLEGQFTACWNCEGRIGQVVERIDRQRRRVAYPYLLLWIVLASMAAGAFALLKAQYGAWP